MGFVKKNKSNEATTNDIFISLKLQIYEGLT